MWCSISICWRTTLVCRCVWRRHPRGEPAPAERGSTGYRMASARKTDLSGAVSIRTRSGRCRVSVSAPLGEVTAIAKEIFDVVIELRARREPFALATVIETAGSASAKTGAKAVIGHDGRVVAGWVGCGCAESTACHTALECMRSGETRVIDIDLNDEVLGAGRPGGGSMRVYVEPVLPKPTLRIMGHGRVAECLCLLADQMGHEVLVNDPMADRVRYPAAGQHITDDKENSQHKPQAGDKVVIDTQQKGENESMKRALGSQAGY